MSKVKFAICIAIMLSSSCSLGMRSGRAETDDPEFSSILAQLGIVNVLEIEKQGDADDSVLIVTSNPMKFGSNGCLADRTDIELERHDNEWAVRSKNTSHFVSFANCDEVKKNKSEFADVDGRTDLRLAAIAIDDFREIVSSERYSGIAVVGDANLRGLLKKDILRDFDSISSQSDKGVYFQFSSEKIFPEILGVELSYTGGHLSKIELDNRNSYEVIGP